MSDDAVKPPSKTPAARAAHGTSQLLVDLGPVLVFVVAFNVLNRFRPDDAIFWATGVFIAASLAAIIWTKMTRGSVPPVLIVTGVLVTVFGGLAIALHDETFVKLKPTVLYGFFAVAIAGAKLIGQNVWKLMFQHLFEFPDSVWDKLAWRWAGFFAFMAVLNEILRAQLSTEFWVNFHSPIYLVLTLGFAMANAPLMMKYLPTDDGKGGDTPPAS